MEFKNYKALTANELEKYISDLVSEYNNIRSEIDRLCDTLKELDEEYTDVIEYKNNRELLIK